MRGGCERAGWRPEGVCGCGEVALDVRERVGMREGGGVVWVLRMGDVDVAELLWML